MSNGDPLEGLVRRLARRVSFLEQQVHDQGRAQQAADRSVEDGGTQELYDEDDELRAAVGAQPDGSYAVTTYGGPTPRPPSPALIAQVAGGATITWDGFDSYDEQAWPANMGGVRVHLSTLPGDPPTADTLVGFVAGADGGALTVAQPSDVTTFCTLVAVTASGVLSDPSTEVSVTGGSVIADPARTTSIDPPPASSTGYDEGHQWWQIVAGKLEGVWEVTDGAWTTVELVSGQVGYFQQALVEALQVTGLSAVTIDGGSIYIAGAPAASLTETFPGGVMPSGWASTKTSQYGDAPTPPESSAVPGASVVTTFPGGEPGGSNLLINYGNAGVTDETGEAGGMVTSSLPVASDIDVTVRFQVAVVESSGTNKKENGLLAVRSSGVPWSSSWDAITLDLVPFARSSTTDRVQFTFRVYDNSSSAFSASVFVGSLVPNTYWMARLKVQSGVVYVKVWPYTLGGEEPDAWSAVYTDLALPQTPGVTGVVWRQSFLSTFAPSRGQKLWLDTLEASSLMSGFRVNADGTGEWPAIGLGRGDAQWRQVGGAGEPAYQNGWTAFGADGVAFRKLPTGDVTMVGRAAPGANNTTVFTLPVGYRPTRDLTDIITKTQGTGAFGNLDILTDGQVVFRGITGSTWGSFTRSFPTV